MSIFKAFFKDNKVDGRNLKISMEQLPESAWQYITGGPQGGEAVEKYRKAVPWLFRAVQLRSEAVGKMPFEIRSGDNVVDSSKDYQNVLGWLARPTGLLRKVEGSLTLEGKAYLFKGQNRLRNIKDFRYLHPHTITEQYSDDDGSLLNFERSLSGGRKMVLDIDDLVYFWADDPYTEIGPPDASPGMAALAASGVLKGLDDFGSKHLERGLIKAVLLTVGSEGMPVGTKERERIKSWWRSLFSRGVKGGWETDIVNAGVVNPVIIGEGFKELENVEITTEKREDIATATGIPQSILFSNATNFATAQQDEFHFQDKTIVPECEFIQAVLNEQLFRPLGYEWRFLPETLSVFQKEEEQRAEAVVNLTNAAAPVLGNGLAFQFAIEQLGFDVTEEWRQKIEDKVKEEEARPEPSFDTTEQPLPLEGGQQPVSMQKDLSKWRKKARKFAGQPKAAKFDSDLIPPTLNAALAGALEEATSSEDVDNIFAGAWLGYP